MSLSPETLVCKNCNKSYEPVHDCLMFHQEVGLINREESLLIRENTALQAKVEKYENALKQIRDKDTADGSGGKYNSVYEGWEGVAEFAGKALSEPQEGGDE